MKYCILFVTITHDVEDVASPIITEGVTIGSMGDLCVIEDIQLHWKVS
jgi:hypothetical protein